MTTALTTGVTATGFVRKTREEIEDNIKERFRQSFGITFDMSPESPDGQVIGIVADAIHEAWLRAERSYNNFIPSKAFGTGLDGLVELNGIERFRDKPSVATLHINGTPNGYFTTSQKWTASTLPNVTWTANRQIVLNASGEGTATVTCDTLGELSVPRETVWTVSGDNLSVWSDATNPAPAVEGIVLETDSQLRARRLRNTINKGTSTTDSIYEALSTLNLPFIGIKENDTSSIVDNVSPHGILVVVDGGDEQDIAKLIYDNKPAGINTAINGGYLSTSTVAVEDSQGFSHDISFARPNVVSIEIEVEVLRHSGATQAGMDQIPVDLADLINSLNVGDDVRWSSLFAPLYLIPNMEIISMSIGELNGTLAQSSVDVPFGSKASVDVANITITDTTPT